MRSSLKRLYAVRHTPFFSEVLDIASVYPSGSNAGVVHHRLKSRSMRSSFHNLFPLNVLFSDTYPAADIHGRPVETVLNAISSFLCHHPEWQSVFSIPFDRPRAEVVSHLIETKGWRRLTADEGAQLQKLGMEVALGEWADATKSALYVS